MSASSEFYSLSRKVKVRESMYSLGARVNIDYKYRKDEVFGFIWFRLATNGGLLQNKLMKYPFVYNARN
jgi:hypothetical protein